MTSRFPNRRTDAARRVRRWAVRAAALGGLACGVPASAWGAEPTSGAPAGFQSGRAPVALIELYTSEGCSSCPRADEWLARLKDSPRLWSVFVPVAFHVDYWNSPAWKDPWSQPAHTERQTRMTSAWTPPGNYTPALAAHGRAWRNWSAVREPPPLGGDVGVLAVRPLGGRRWSASFAPRRPSAAEPGLHAAILGFGLISRVTGGENVGKTLTHDFVVLGHAAFPMTWTGGTWAAAFAEPAAATGGTARALAVWVERDGRPLQATGGWLERPEGRR